MPRDTDTPRLRIGVIGCGQWGPNQIRVFFFHPQTEVVRICDRDPDRLKFNQTLYPQVQVTQVAEDITRAKDIDAVVIATPVSTHFELAQEALKQGKDVLCEKPLTMKLEEARQLVRLAREKKRILMVGHVFLFNAGILKLKEILRNKVLGNVYYFHSERTNLGPVRNDVNAIHDLASHDISIFNFLMDSTPRVVSVTGKCYLRPEIEDVAFISLEYPGGVLAQVHVSWLDPRKVREITAVGNEKMATWNDLALSGPVRIYSKRVERTPYYKDYGEFQLLAKEGEQLIPYVQNVEPLKTQADHFVKCLLKREKPVCDGENAIQVMDVLEQIDKLRTTSGGRG